MPHVARSLADDQTQPVTSEHSNRKHQPRGRPTRIGLIINPIAGMGGSVGLHGTDGDASLKAQRMGAQPIAVKRAKRTLDLLASLGSDLEMWAASGTMGEELARQAGLDPKPVHVGSSPTNSEDTILAAREMAVGNIDLILFAGGDGTASDIVSTVYDEVPILGIPTGVKMHSAVFATTPESAGDIAIRFVQNPSAVPLHQREVVDPDLDSTGINQLAFATVPFSSRSLQSTKAASSVGNDLALDKLCAGLAEDLEKDRLFILGPGTSTNRILVHLDLEAPLIGVKVLRNRTLHSTDATEAEILEVLDEHVPATIILGVIGGQGFLLGRGNQQISPEVIDRVGEHNVLIIASEDKISSLDPAVLRVDTGHEHPASAMTGYRRVHTQPGRSVVMKVIS